MIEKRTVFVLGAGASMPYGFPSGAELRDLIYQEALLQGSELQNTLHLEFGIGPSGTAAFGTAFRRSMQPSIDAFLGKRPDMADVGKLAIAYAICRRELPDTVFDGGRGDDWYLELWRAMTHDIHDPARLKDNAVRFVTFNYDRSLEQLMHEGTKNSYGLSDEGAAMSWSAIPIVHVYGAVGAFGLATSGEWRAYTHATSGDALRIAAAGIRVVPEARHDDEAFRTAHEWLLWAEQICFLGFGFDPLNVERLAINPLMEGLAEKALSVRLPRVYASVFGLTPREIEERVKKPMNRLKVVTVTEKNLMTLRTTGVLE
jgi:hypothetical protein